METLSQSLEVNSNQTEANVLSVSQLTSKIKMILETQFGTLPFWVEGEISNFRGVNYSGHGYFNLKDETALIPAVMFKAALQKNNYDVKDGLKVQALGRISLYAPHGRYQLIIEKIKPAGEGDLFAKFEALKKDLQKRGWFDDSLKKPLPKLPKKIGVVTSPTGAVIRDIVNGLNKRFPHVDVIIFPVRVQGDEAAKEIAHAICQFDTEIDVDIIIVARGGGSIEDLWAFNEEIVAAAIVNSRTPIVSAVGHMTDFTICDFVSDCRASTPSNAVELSVPDYRELQQRFMDIRSSIIDIVRREFVLRRGQLEDIKNRRIVQHPGALVIDRRHQLNDVTHRLHRLIERRLQVKSHVDSIKQRLIQNMTQLILRKQKDIEVLKTKLNMLNPYAILERGYSIVNDKHNAIITSSSQVCDGDTLNVILHKGQLLTTVEKTVNENE